jgi:hypothetical protein
MGVGSRVRFHFPSNFGRRSPPFENDRLVLGSVSASIPYYPGPR